MTSNAAGARRILGTVRSDGGKGVVRIEDRFDTDIDDLWSALTDPRRLAKWIGEVKGDLRLGGEFRAHFFTSGWEGTGRVEACDPPRRLRVTSKDAGEPYETVMEATLTAAGNQTMLVIEESGMPPDKLFGYGAGVQIEIENLAAHVAKRSRAELEVGLETRWAELLPAYRQLAAESLATSDSKIAANANHEEGDTA